jgi:hypothetical protein
VLFSFPFFSFTNIFFSKGKQSAILFYFLFFYNFFFQ